MEREEKQCAAELQAATDRLATVEKRSAQLDDQLDQYDEQLAEERNRTLAASMDAEQTRAQHAELLEQVERGERAVARLEAELADKEAQLRALEGVLGPRARLRAARRRAGRRGARPARRGLRARRLAAAAGEAREAAPPDGGERVAPSGGGRRRAVRGPDDLDTAQAPRRPAAPRRRGGRLRRVRGRVSAPVLLVRVLLVGSP